jgi:alanyl-tRNA synthetase
MRDLMALSKEICDDPKAVAILGARAATRASLIVSHGSDVRLDAREVFSEAVKSIGGRGGGRPDFTQGAGPRVDGLTEALETALRLTRERVSNPSG